MTVNRWPLLLGLILSLGSIGAGFAVGTGQIEQWQLAARWTARVGFPVFIVTYTASSLLRLAPSPTTKALVRDRRWWGLGFAASHTVHLYALVTYLTLSGEGRPLPVLLGGGGAYAILYAMVLTSSNSAQRALGRNWKRLHTVGIHWLWAVFAFSYFGRIIEPESMMTGVIGSAIAFTALGLRIAVWWKARVRRVAA